MEELAAAARALCERLREVDDAVTAAFQIAALHHMPYSGPNYDEELKAVENILAGPRWKRGVFMITDFDREG